MTLLEHDCSACHPHVPHSCPTAASCRKRVLVRLDLKQAVKRSHPLGGLDDFLLPWR